MLACIMLNHFYSPNRLWIHLLGFTCDFFVQKQLSFLWGLITPCHLWRVISTHFSHEWVHNSVPREAMPLYPDCSMSTPWQLCHLRRVHYGIVPSTDLSFRSESRSLLNIQLPVEHPAKLHSKCLLNSRPLEGWVNRKSFETTWNSPWFWSCKSGGTLIYCLLIKSTWSQDLMGLRCYQL